MEKIDSQEQLQDCKDERSPTQRLPVKMRLGSRPNKTSSQERLRVRAPSEDVEKKEFRVKRVRYSNAINKSSNVFHNMDNNYGAKSSGSRTNKPNHMPTFKLLNQIRPCIG